MILHNLASLKNRFLLVFYVLLGLVAVDLTIWLCSPWLRPYDPNEYRERLENCWARGCDLLVIGGSPVSEGVDTGLLKGLEIAGKAIEKPFNLGLPGATTMDSFHALERALDGPNVRPSLILYGITASDLNDARREPKGPRNLMTCADVVDSWRVSPSTIEWATRHYAEGNIQGVWQLFRYRNSIRNLCGEKIESAWPGACPELARDASKSKNYWKSMQAENGFAPWPPFQKSNLEELKKLGNVPDFPFLKNYKYGEHFRYLGKMAELARRKKVPFILLDMPVSQELELVRNPGAFSVYRDELAKCSKTLGLEVIWGAREKAGLKDRDFADLIHLNSRGSEKLSNWVALSAVCATGNGSTPTLGGPE